MPRPFRLPQTILAMALLLVSATAMPAQEATAPKTLWEIDNNHSSLVFAVSHQGLSFVYGRFNEVAGDVRLDPKTPETATFQFQVRTQSIDTNNRLRDAHLQSETFLDAENFPLIEFTSTKLEYKTGADSPTGGKTFLITGNLTMHGQTRTIVIPLDLLSIATGPEGDRRCGFFGKFVVKRSDYGVGAMPQAIGDSVAMTFCFQASKAEEVEEKKEDPLLDVDTVTESEKPANDNPFDSNLGSSKKGDADTESGGPEPADTNTNTNGLEPADTDGIDPGAEDTSATDQDDEDASAIKQAASVLESDDD